MSLTASAAQSTRKIQGGVQVEETTQKTIRVLLVEDNPGDARLLRDTLAEVDSARFELTHVDRLSTALERLSERGFDVILLDLSLPDSWGLDSFYQVHAQEPAVPIVILTSFDVEGFTIEAVQRGAQDYLIKGQTDRTLMVRSLRYAIERKRAEAALRVAESRLRLVVDNTPVMIFSLDQDGVFTLSEGKGLEALNRKPGQVVGRSIFEMYDEFPIVLEKVRLALAGEPCGVVVEMSGVIFDARYEPLRDESGAVVGVVGVIYDITDLKRAEAERERLIVELREALAKIKTLTGLLPICASCKKIRDDNGYWNQIESYIQKHSEAEFSHGICPNCAKTLYPEFYSEPWSSES